MGPMVAGNRIPKIVWTVRIFRFVRLLRSKPISAQITIQNSRGNLVADDRAKRGPADVELSTVMMGCPINGFGPDLRLKYGRYRFCLMLQATSYPTKLRRVERRHLDCSKPNLAL